MDESLEGWYTDPYARHEARWMSDGVPTQLVRDGNVEGHDPAPDEPFTVTPVRVEGNNDATRGANFRRADDAKGLDTYDPKKMARAAWEAFDQSLNSP